MALYTQQYALLIAANAAVSAGARIDGRSPVAVILPPAWTDAALMVEGSMDGALWVQPDDVEGNPMVFSVRRSGTFSGFRPGIQIPPALIHGWDFLRLVSVSPTDLATPVNQAAARTLTLVAATYFQPQV